MASNARIMPILCKAVTTDKVWPGVHVSSGANQKYFAGIRVLASLDADATVALLFAIPTGAIPTGLLKLILTAVTSDNAAAAAKVNPKWAAVSLDSEWAATALVAEGTQTLSISADDDKPQELAVTLDATTLPTVGQFIVMNCVFETASWTIAQTSTWQFWLEYRA